MPQPTLRKLFFCFVVFLITSCKKEENFTCKITFFNGVIGSSPITLKADNFSIADNLRYDSLKRDVAIPSGTYNISQTTSGQSQNLLLTNLGSNETYTAVAYDSSKRATFFMRKDVFPSTPGFGRCAVRIYTLIPDASNLFLAKDTSKPIITGKSFNDFVNGTNGPAFQEIDAIDTLKIFRSDSVRIALVPTEFRSGKIYSLYITGSIKDSARLHPKCIVQVHN